MAAWEHDGQHDTYRHAMLWCFLTHLTAIYNVFAMSLQCLCNVFACHMFQVQRVPWIFHVCFALLTFWGSKKSAVCSITGWMPSTARSLGIDLYDETSAVPQSFGGETGEENCSFASNTSSTSKTRKTQNAERCFALKLFGRDYSGKTMTTLAKGQDAEEWKQDLARHRHWRGKDTMRKS